MACSAIGDAFRGWVDRGTFKSDASARGARKAPMAAVMHNIGPYEDDGCVPSLRPFRSPSHSPLTNNRAIRASLSWKPSHHARGGRGSRARRRVRRVRASPGRGVGILRCPFEGSRWVYDPPTRLRSAHAPPRVAAQIPEESDRQKRDCDSRPRLTSATSTSSPLPRAGPPMRWRRTSARTTTSTSRRRSSSSGSTADGSSVTTSRPRSRNRTSVRACSWCARAGPSSSRTSGSARSTRTSRKGTTR